MKSELRKLLEKNHIPHTEAENKLFRTLLTRVDHVKLKEKFGVDLSASAEGGLAIPYSWLNIDGFGEQLHLRFNDQLVFIKGSKDPVTQWVMVLIPNSYKQRDKWTPDERQKVLEGANKILKAATNFLEFVRKSPEKLVEESVK